MKVAINGMGRIGRLLFRKLVNHSGMEVVAVNDVMDPENLAYLVRHDSIYGNTTYPVSYYNGKLVAGDKEIACFTEPDPAKLPWKQLEVDVVLECSGKFTTKHAASLHLHSGAKKVLLSTTGSDD